MNRFKKTTARLLIAAILVSVSAASYAQSENPRGIYKLMSLKGKVEVKPYISDIYKIITDSVTMRFYVEDRNKNRFRIDMPDFKPFNYTGERKITDETDTEQQIYDSDSKRFTQKWWCVQSPNHPIFPYKDWCYEFYESGQFSKEAKPILDAITSEFDIDSKNPLIGIWELITTQDELLEINNWNGVLKYLRKHNSNDLTHEFHIYTSSNTVTVQMVKWFPTISGNIQKIEYKDKNKVLLDENRIRDIIWLTDNAFAIKTKVGEVIKYNIFERATNKETMLSRIGSHFINQNKPKQKDNQNKIGLDKDF